MSFAQVIQEAAVKRAERAAHAEHVAQVRRDELIEGARQADRSWRRGYRNDELWDSSYAPIDFKPWYDYIVTRRQAGDMPGQIALHISKVESKPCGYRQINGVLAMLSKPKKIV